jgi:large subunit ribosomal protein L17
MRHGNRRGKLERPSGHRTAMLRNLVTSLLEHEQVETTDPRAKELRRLADRVITLGKRGDQHARRQALRIVRTDDVAAKVFGELATRYRARRGGYTRVLKARLRVGDAAPLSLVELVDRPQPKASAKPAKAE